MKLLKSLILGATAICAASWGAQAADLPVKAKPVEYVKICSAYGAGFYYIPGTEICLRVGGYVWYDININQRGEGVDIGNAPQVNNSYGPLTTRVRAIMIMDARTNTQYGTLRSYIALGEQWTSCNTLSAAVPSTASGANGCSQNSGSGASAIVGDATVYMERAFIQFAGWTFGYVGSFFDFNPSYSMTSLNTASFKWTPAIAYTIQFGNGVSTTASLEDSTTRRSQIGGCTPGTIPGPFPIAPANPSANCGALAGVIVIGGLPYAGVGAVAFTGYGGAQAPVIVWNARVDQAWGSALLSVSGHELKVNQFEAGFGVQDKWGWAVLAGIEVKTPTGPGDSFMLQGVWGSGSAEYTGITNFPVLVFGGVGRRNQIGQGPVFDIMDSFITAGLTQELTTQWAINGQFRHFWNPMLRSAIFAGFNSQQMGPLARASGYPDLELWQAGLNTIWSPVKDFDLGVEILYTNIRTVCSGVGVFGVFGCPFTTAAVAGVQAQNTSADVWSGMFRARRNW